MSRRSLYLLVPVLVVAVVGAIILFKTRRTSETAPGTKRLEAELVTVREFGFEPKQIRRPAGPFILRVENRSGRPRIKLSLTNASNVVLREIPISTTSLNWTERMDLPPGTYLLREANEPEWKCNIEIAAK
jgi:hypothetical protein